MAAGGGRTGEGGKGIETAGFVSRSFEGAGWGSGCFCLSATFVVIAAPDFVDSVESAFDDGRVNLDKPILEGGRALEAVRARFRGGTKDTSFVFSI